MEISAYDFDQIRVSGLLSLINSLYPSSKYRESYKDSVSRELSNNPFFRYSTKQNFVASRGDEVRGHASAFIDSRIPNIGFIGTFECSDRESAHEIVSASIQWLTKQGATIIRGPVNLSIWNRYRFMNPVQLDNLFLFEPFNLPDYPQYFKDHGFTVAETYTSGIRTEYENIIDYSKPSYEHALKNGFTIRNIDLPNYESELKIFHTLSLDIFKGSWSFVPISFDEFKWLYQGFDAKMGPQYCQFICKDAKAIGFCFGIPDYFSAKKQLIMKTIGVLPEYQKQNLGSALIYSFHTRAKEEKYESVVYALLREGNVASKINPYGATFFRRYETYELML